MADKPKGTQRRGFKVAGQTPEEEEASRVRPRSVDEAFRLTNQDAPPEGAEGERIYPPRLLEAFLQGRITLGDLEGVTKQEQYQMAETGHAYLTQRKLDKAKVVFEGLLALDPFDAYFNMALASIAQQEERYEDALQLYARALEINPFSPTAYANRGEIHVMQGNLHVGVEDLVKALELDPKMKEPATERARSTLMVLREQLAGLDADDLKRRAEQTTGAKIPAAAAKIPAAPSPRQTPPAAQPRPRVAAPRGQARPRVPGRSGPRAAGPRAAGPRRSGPRGGPRSR